MGSIKAESDWPCWLRRLVSGGSSPLRVRVGAVGALWSPSQEFSLARFRPFTGATRDGGAGVEGTHGNRNDKCPAVGTPRLAQGMEGVYPAATSGQCHPHSRAKRGNGRFWGYPLGGRTEGLGVQRATESKSWLEQPLRNLTSQSGHRVDSDVGQPLRHLRMPKAVADVGGRRIHVRLYFIRTAEPPGI